MPAPLLFLGYEFAGCPCGGPPFVVSSLAELPAGVARNARPSARQPGGRALVEPVCPKCQRVLLLDTPRATVRISGLGFYCCARVFVQRLVEVPIGDTRLAGICSKCGKVSSPIDVRDLIRPGGPVRR